MELVDVVDGWLWRTGKIDNMPEWCLVGLVDLWWKKQRIRW
jgi:hypothetical protein